MRHDGGEYVFGVYAALGDYGLGVQVETVVIDILGIADVVQLLLLHVAVHVLMGGDDVPAV